MFKPKYSISNRLARTLRQIGEAMGTIKAAGLAELGLRRLVLDARSLSAHASTSIEGNPLPLTDVKRLLKAAPTNVRDTEREVLNYNQALDWLQKAIEEGVFTPTAKTFTLLQGLVTQGLMDNPTDVGAIRQRPVIIRDPSSPDGIVFLPPDHGDVAQLLEGLMDFVQANLNEIEPVILAGLFHKQAVIIHPYMDGNGRSTRLMSTGLLGLTGLDLFSIFSFEAYYNRNVTRYFKMVGEQGDFYDLGNDLDFTPWLEYFADGILDELLRVQQQLERRPIRLEVHHQQIIDYLEQHGTLTQRELERVSSRSLPARKKDLAFLVEQGLIRPEKGGRSRYYVLA
jgi:Fic family protein